MKRFVNPVPQYLKSNGDLCSSGKIYFLQEGSDTLTDTKAIYLDAEGATQSVNPVPLSDQGRTPNVFGEGKYRVKLYDADNILQWTRDIDFDSSSSQFGPWNSQESYSINDIARGESGDYYKSEINNNRGNDPDLPASSDKWSKIALLEFFNADKPGGYPDNAIVILNGRLYASNIANNTNTPPHASWDDLSFNNAVVGDFSATGDATFATLELQNSNDSDPLKLDWYEEGTFTPVVEGTGLVGSCTYTSQFGRYTRIGNVVHISIVLGWSGHTGTADMKITGLPFVAARSAPLSFRSTNLTIGAGKLVSFPVSVASSTINPRLIDQASGGDSGLPIDSSVTLLNLSGFYFAD